MDIKIDKNSKKIIILLFIYMSVILAIFLPGYLSRRGTLIMMTSNYKIKYKDGKWSIIDDTKDYNLKKFNVYEGNNYLGEYQIIYSNKFNLYKNGKQYKYNDNIFAYRGSLALKLYDSEVSYSMTEEDNSIIDRAKEKIGIIDDNNVDAFKLTTDINKDGRNDAVYFVSGNSFSILFLCVNTDISIIEKSINVDDDRLYVFDRIVDIKNDNSPELIYTGFYPNGSLKDSCPKIYDLVKKKIIYDFCE